MEGHSGIKKVLGHPKRHEDMWNGLNRRRFDCHDRALEQNQ